MSLKIEGKEYNLSEKALEKVAKTQKKAMELADKHLREPLDKILKAKLCTGHVLSCALIELAYFNLRTKYSPENAAEAMDIYTHFAKTRIDASLDKRQIH